MKCPSHHIECGREVGDSQRASLVTFTFITGGGDVCQLSPLKVSGFPFPFSVLSTLTCKLTTCFGGNLKLVRVADILRYLHLGKSC